MSSNIPFIPSSAPFTPEQRAWLNGYFVGLLSTAHGADTTSAAAPEQKLEPLLIGFGSQTGSAEQLAKRIAKESAQHGFSAELKELNAITLETLSSTPRFLIVTSTWGDGEPPDNAADFFKSLHAETAPRLESLSYSVLALGDKNYSDFCGAGRKVDERLQSLGAKRLLPRTDCDVDFETSATQWIAGVWAALSNTTTATPISPITPITPISSYLSHHRALTEILPPKSLPRSPPRKPHLKRPGLRQRNPSHRNLSRRRRTHLRSWRRSRRGPPQLSRLRRRTHPHRRLERIRTHRHLRHRISPALRSSRHQTRPPQTNFRAPRHHRQNRRLRTHHRSPHSRAQAAPQEYLGQREVIDLFYEFPKFRPGAAEFVTLLAKLQPRLYSISSSLNAFPAQVHLTVGIVRYETCNRPRKGLCSTFLADRVEPNGTVPVFVQPSHGFKLPKDPATPIIMVGPGTGIAPFRAFLHERRAAAAPGKNWLFFGDQQSASDFLYRDELESLQSSGYLARLDTAFSRDQKEKIYVQNRMLENAAELFSWLEQGAHFYVCGDAKRMAKDVDAALHKVIELNHREPTEYISTLKSQKRYQRDVY